MRECGCDQVHCQKRRFDFNLTAAEQVTAAARNLKETFVVSGKAASFRGRCQSRQAHKEYMESNGIADTPSDAYFLTKKQSASNP